MAKRYVIANWKMNLPPEGLEKYLDAVGARQNGPALVVAPPFPYLKEARRKAAPSMGIAAQNCADHQSGAFTGEVSVGMLRDCGAKFVIIGHSERRTLYHETDAVVARKLALAIPGGLTPVLCIGEDLKVRDAGHVARFLADQLKAAATPELEQAEDVLVAYEPIWAIGTGRNATPAMVAEAVGEIRHALTRFWPAKHSEAAILYGGSATPDNVAGIAAEGKIDGFLVGGASLDSGKFLAISRALGSA